MECILALIVESLKDSTVSVQSAAAWALANAAGALSQDLHPDRQHCLCLASGVFLLLSSVLINDIFLHSP